MIKAILPILIYCVMFVAIYFVSNPRIIFLLSSGERQKVIFTFVLFFISRAPIYMHVIYRIIFFN